MSAILHTNSAGEVELRLTREQAEAVHHALYLRLRELSMIEDHDPDPHRRSWALREARPVLEVADMLPPRAAIATTKEQP